MINPKIIGIIIAIIVIIYVISPIDVIPDIIPIIGWIDDLIVLIGGGMMVLRFLH